MAAATRRREGGLTLSMVQQSPQLQKPNRGKLSVDWGVSSVKGMRKTQEDQHTIEPHMKLDTQEDTCSSFSFFAVYDGHGGRDAAIFVHQRLHKFFLEEVTKTTPTSQQDYEAALMTAFHRVEDDFTRFAQETARKDSGTTAAVAVVYDKNLLIGNIGDSEIVLSRNGVGVSLAPVHNPEKNEEEAARVKEEGGELWHNRLSLPAVNPRFCSIALSRAIGDVIFKEPQAEGKSTGLSAEPDVFTVNLLEGQDQFLIVGCDGLWDVMSPQQAVDLVSSLLEGGVNAESVTKALTKEALRLGSSDNVTAIVVMLNWGHKKQANAEKEGETLKAFINSSAITNEEGYKTPDLNADEGDGANAASSAQKKQGEARSSQRRSESTNATQG